MIRPDLRKFGIKHILLAMVWVAIAVTLLPWKMWLVNRFGWGMLGFAGGLLVLFLADVIDHRGVNDRNYVSWLLNLIGILVVIASLMLMLFSFVFGLGMMVTGMGSNLHPQNPLEAFDVA